MIVHLLSLFINTGILVFGRLIFDRAEAFFPPLVDNYSILLSL